MCLSCEAMDQHLCLPLLQVNREQSKGRDQESHEGGGKTLGLLLSPDHSCKTAISRDHKPVTSKTRTL